MQVAPIISQTNQISFNSLSVFKKKDDDLQTADKETYDNDRLSKSLKGLAIASTAILGFGLLRYNNIDPLKTVKNSLSKIVYRHYNKLTPDPILQKLNGKRDASAVRKYKSIIAQKKLKSLQNKLLDGDFNNKSQAAFTAIVKNSRKLTRDALV